MSNPSNNPTKCCAGSTRQPVFLALQVIVYCEFVCLQYTVIHICALTVCDIFKKPKSVSVRYFKKTVGFGFGFRYFGKPIYI